MNINMNKKKKNLETITIVFVVLVSFLLPIGTQTCSGASSKKSSQKKLTPTSHITKSTLEFVDVDHDQHDKSTTYLNYAKASYQQLKAGSDKNGKFYLQEALKNYHQVLSSDTSIYPYEGMIRLLFDCGHYAKIVELYEKRQKEFDDAFGKNTEIQLALAQSLIMVNKEQQAEAIFSDLIQKNPANAQIAYHTAVSYINNFIQHLKIDPTIAKTKYIRAQNFLDACIAKKSLKARHFLFYFLKSKLALSYNDKNKALTYIEKSLALMANFDQGILLKAMLLQQLGNVNEAIKGYQNYLTLTGRDDAVEKQLMELLFSQKRFDEAAEYQKKQTLENTEANSGESYFDLALLERKAERFDSALEHIDKALEKNPHLMQARLLKLDILLASKKNERALSCLESWIAQDPDDLISIHTLLLLKHAGITRQDLIKTLEAVAKKHQSVKIFAALADLHVEEKKYKTGLTWYKKILSLAKAQQEAQKDPALLSKTLFYIGYLFYLAKNVTKVEAILKQAIANEPVYAPAYNLLAYHYAQTNTNLDEALTLVEKALSNQQDCYYYLDTKGLILLKLDRHEEAIKTLEIAHSLALDDQVISEHLALAKGEHTEVKEEEDKDKEHEKQKK